MLVLEKEKDRVELLVLVKVLEAENGDRDGDWDWDEDGKLEDGDGDGKLEDWDGDGEELRSGDGVEVGVWGRMTSMSTANTAMDGMASALLTTHKNGEGYVRAMATAVLVTAPPARTDVNLSLIHI